jgi:hypothetical protein
MPITSGVPLFYVTNSGQVHKVVSASDERSGIVDVKTSDGRTSAVSALSVFNTQAAANIAANNRRAGKSKVELPQIFR